MKINLHPFVLASILLVVSVLSCNNQNSAPKKNDKADSSAAAKPQGAATVTFTDNEYNKAARYIAGLKQLSENEYATWEAKPEWVSYSKRIDSLWESLETKRFTVMRKFYNDEFGSSRNEERPVFYPFSGPDWLNISLAFPNGSQYVMNGLEPVGNIPEPARLTGNGELSRSLNDLLKGLRTLNERGYFITSYMSGDLTRNKLNGVLPIMYFLLARTHCNIMNVEYVGLDSTGAEHKLASVSDESSKKYIRGAKIVFQNDSTKKQGTIYYFTGDVSNTGFKKNSGYFNFVKNNFKETNTYMKAASYLLYDPTMTMMNELVLSQTHTLLTDDSGMKYANVNNGRWDIKLYGKYTGPTKDFPWTKQQELIAYYAEHAAEIKAIPFGTGYHWKEGESNLMFCIKK